MDSQQQSFCQELLSQVVFHKGKKNVILNYKESNNFEPQRQCLEEFWIKVKWITV